ncbi:MAG: 3-methyl-2-oxobutanoate hydroxymethyltransferase [Candidatus Heimdallarchaeota archaeon LC_3]|nr:MAG: 3-methyl-2-oxobutanoate hydroxymethyltransferase [Candidatus Heimdallarchaeota archaeon LC_3]
MEFNKLKITSRDIISFKNSKKISMLTAYDYQFARILDDAKIDILLVGDSLGMVMYGETSTLPVTLEQAIMHTKAVSKGATNHSLVVGDMPFLTFGVSKEETIRNAGRFIKEGRAEAIKLEGGFSRVEEVHALKDIGIPVMGHLGLTPQSFHDLGGYKVQGKSVEIANKIIKEALALEEAGVFSIVLEAIPWQLSKVITNKIQIPTIGIGAGLFCDGQVLVTHDMLGLTPSPHPRFVKQYVNLEKQIQDAVNLFKIDIENGKYPSSEHQYAMSDEEYQNWKKKMQS